MHNSRNEGWKLNRQGKNVELITHDKASYLPVWQGRAPKIILEDSKPYSPHCQISASNDAEAVVCWLNRYKNNPNTFKAYYKESKRFILWCTYERGLTLGTLKAQDFEAYLDFLKNPPMQWCLAISSLDSKRGKARPLLQKGLSESACRMSIRSVNALMNYLVEADYLRTNPLKLLKRAEDKTFDQEMQKYQVWERMLENDEWEALQQALQNMPIKTNEEIDNKMRTQFLFALLYLLGLRIHEVALSSWNAFRKREGQWWFFIRGKGGKPGHIPVNEQLLSYVKSYRLHVGLTPLPTLDETNRLLISKRTKKPLKVRQLYGLVKTIGKTAAKSFANQPLKKKKLEQFSPHWLRHLSASHQDKAGIPATMIQANHRHSRHQTTQIYLHAEEALRASEIQKLRMQIEPSWMVQPSVPNKAFLKIIFKGGPLSNKLSFSRLVNTIEENILREVDFERETADLEALLNRYEPLKKLGDPLTICYYLSSFKEEGFDELQKAIKREASIRLFECTLFLKMDDV